MTLSQAQREFVTRIYENEPTTPIARVVKMTGMSRSSVARIRDSIISPPAKKIDVIDKSPKTVTVRTPIEKLAIQTYQIAWAAGEHAAKLLADAKNHTEREIAAAIRAADRAALAYAKLNARCPEVSQAVNVVFCDLGAVKLEDLEKSGYTVAEDDGGHHRVIPKADENHQVPPL